MQELGHGSEDEVREIIDLHLDWFLDHLDWKYICKTYSGTSFCDRFEDVMDLHDRWHKSHGHAPDQYSDYDTDPSQYKPMD
mgnify:FL=1